MWTLVAYNRLRYPAGKLKRNRDQRLSTEK